MGANENLLPAIETSMCLCTLWWTKITASFFCFFFLNKKWSFGEKNVKMGERSAFPTSSCVFIYFAVSFFKLKYSNFIYFQIKRHLKRIFLSCVLQNWHRLIENIYLFSLAHEKRRSNSVFRFNKDNFLVFFLCFVSSYSVFHFISFSFSTKSMR